MMNLPPQMMDQRQPPMQGMPQMGEMREQGTPQAEEPEKIVAHFSLDELQDLDKVLLELLQSIYNKPVPQEILFDPETKLRDYTPLDQILRNPEVESAFSSALSQGHQKFAEGGDVELGRPIDPELEKLRLEGEQGDKELAIITPFLMEKFSEWAGREPKINQETGLPEFGFFSGIFRTIARVVAPVVGAVFGGPVGAALAGGLATKLTGGSWGQSLGAGALSGLGAFAAPMIGGAFQSAFPNASAALGSGVRGLFGENIGGALSNLFTPGASTTGGGQVFGLGDVGRMIPGTAQGMGQAATQLAPKVAGAQAPQMGMGLLGNLTGALTKGLPLLGAGLMLAKGHKEDKKNAENYEDKQRQQSEEIRNKLGFNSPLKKVKPFEYGEANFNIPREKYERGIIPRYFNYNLADQYAAEGGPIRGNGKGQQDNIPEKLRDGSYIIDASTVSDIGDGSTDAGYQELNKSFLHSSSPPIPHKSRGGYLDAMVSNGEYKISPEEVTHLGNGSNERGARILDKLVQEIRKKKRTSGQKLPPKSKSVDGYLKRLNAA